MQLFYEKAPMLRKYMHAVRRNRYRQQFSF